MPNCFQLVRKGHTKATPLNTIDRELCQLLGVKEHPKLYVAGWFNNIGFSLAMGKTFDEIVEKIEKDIASDKPEDLPYQENDKLLLKCANYLRDNYKSNAWVEIGRR